MALHPAGAGAAPAADLQLHVGAQDAWRRGDAGQGHETAMVDWVAQLRCVYRYLGELYIYILI